MWIPTQNITGRLTGANEASSSSSFFKKLSVVYLSVWAHGARLSFECDRGIALSFALQREAHVRVASNPHFLILLNAPFGATHRFQYRIDATTATRWWH